MGAQVVVRSVEGTKFAQEVRANGHALVADEPSSIGGEGRGPGPYELLLAALGT